MIYPVDSVIQPLNNRVQILKNELHLRVTGARYIDLKQNKFSNETKKAVNYLKESLIYEAITGGFLKMPFAFLCKIQNLEQTN